LHEIKRGSRGGKGTKGTEKIEATVSSSPSRERGTSYMISEHRLKAVPLE
jgi:hypothetical protein